MPVERWTAHQVAALAPDSSSLTAARAVAGAALWPASGSHDDLVWGRCRSYDVAVDLGGPAFKCSCPSRKIPCKHGLALLLRWADGAVGASDPPQWADEWRAARAARAPRTGEVADPAAAHKRAQQRVDRVDAGLAELRQWLDDQVRQGLAGLGSAGHRPFEAMAARLVDAQAPTAASAVRRLGTFAGIGPQWADRMLGELALLRLLVTGWERRAALPGPLAATVRARIGFPAPVDEVLAGPRLRDRWQVLGVVESDEGMLTTRRTWLRGAGTGRFALLLAFAPVGQGIESEVVPGASVDAELCFYPGAWPLRAVIAQRHGPFEPVTEAAGAESLAAALRRWAATLAAEPWRHDTPVLLAGVAPGPQGWLVDSSGDALPLAPGHREPWWLLAAAGGRPATVAAEWSASGLRPLAAWTGGRYVPAAPAAPEFGAAVRVPELPGELLAAALVGTARRPWTGRAVTVGGRSLALAGAPAFAAAGTPEAALLGAAAAALVYRRAGVTASAGHEPVPAAPPETGRPTPAAAGDRLLRILADAAAPGGAQAGQELLQQWLALAAEYGGHAPPEALPTLFDAGRRNTTLRPVLGRVAGRRGAWLAALRPDWGWLLDEAPGSGVPDDPATWETGSGGERIAYLAQLRGRAPDEARELLERAWPAESTEDRTRLLAVLETGLSTADDAFLDAVLDDRRREVREVALDLLRRLPGSGLRGRMTARARSAVRRERLPSGRFRLVVEPPTDLDADLRRDGVGASPARGAAVSAWLLEEIVASTPLQVWTQDVGPDPAAALELARGQDWEAALVHGWAKAAIVQRAGDWAAALVAADAHNPAAGLRDALRWDLHLLLAPDALAGLAAELLRREDHLANRLLAIHPGGWPHELVVAVLETIARRARTDRHSWQLAELCRSAAMAMPPRYAGHLALLADQLEQAGTDPTRVRPVADLARTLTFRHEMNLEFE